MAVIKTIVSLVEMNAIRKMNSEKTENYWGWSVGDLSVRDSSEPQGWTEYHHVQKKA